MSNYSKVSVANDPRTELHDQLGLTGAEISINHLPAGASVPFVHYHKTNEEIYIILSGKGKAVVDGEDIELSAGDIVRIAPDGKRQFFAADDSEISYACIQVKASSLKPFRLPIAPYVVVQGSYCVFVYIISIVVDCLLVQLVVVRTTQ